MRAQHPGSSDSKVVNKPPSGPDIDYSPKKLERGETLVVGVKFLVFAGIVLILFWLLENYLF